MDRFERDADSELSLGGIPIRFGNSERTIGYRYTESILPVDVSIYVLGTVQEGGGIEASPPRDKSQRFVVSHRSEEALGQSLGKSALWLGVGGVGALVVGAVLLAVGLFVLIS